MTYLIVVYSGLSSAVLEVRGRHIVYILSHNSTVNIKTKCISFLKKFYIISLLKFELRPWFMGRN